MTEQGLSPEVKRALINQELVGLNQASYLLSMRHKVNKKLGATAEELKPIEEQLLKVEQQIDEWNKVLAEIK